MKLQAEHCDALKAMLPPGSPISSGYEAYRRLRRLELMGQRLAVRISTDPELTQEDQERVKMKIREGLRAIFDRTLPGLFLNWDPRGYCIKLEPKSVPHDLHKDWGGNQILAPDSESFGS